MTILVTAAMLVQYAQPVKVITIDHAGAIFGNGTDAPVVETYYLGWSKWYRLSNIAETPVATKLADNEEVAGINEKGTVLRYCPRIITDGDSSYGGYAGGGEFSICGKFSIVRGSDYLLVSQQAEGTQIIQGKYGWCEVAVNPTNGRLAIVGEKEGGGLEVFLSRWETQSYSSLEVLEKSNPIIWKDKSSRVKMSLPGNLLVSAQYVDDHNLVFMCATNTLETGVPYVPGDYTRSSSNARTEYSYVCIMNLKTLICVPVLRLGVNESDLGDNSPAYRFLAVSGKYVYVLRGNKVVVLDRQKMIDSVQSM